jgi:hypothetical protein
MFSPLTGTGPSMNDLFEESTYDWENASIGEDTVARETNDERIKLLQDEDEVMAMNALLPLERE